MTDTVSSLHRRSFLLGVGGALGSVAGATSVVGAPNGAGDHRSETTVRRSGFVLEQNGICLPLAMVTLDERVPVEEFYDYRSSDTTPSGWYSSYGPAQRFQRNGESVLYCYDGPRGTSLVFMHGMRGGESGGAITFSISGLPSEGEWAVTDDQYNASTNYDRFVRNDGEWVVDWTWATDPDNGGGADGGAFRGITRDDVVRIDPAFNENARLYEDHYPGDVEHWRALTADSTGYRWRSLRRDHPIVIRGGSCDDGTPTSTAVAPTETSPTATRTTTTPTRTATRTTTTPTRTTTANASRSPRMPHTTPVATDEPSRTTTTGQHGFGVAAAVAGLLCGVLPSIARRNE
ncbi:hypothetical protein [Haladaptatus caseinilyticus]|uniref:hypothetical protein n=1 Tax=Haladaptatus caseinilyticus TaxID=2993314 RepID=UPI00224A6583|nr:hypothetical protein [Haladaptatus caseinilyticus]